jgi:hypothetical protein
VLKKPACKRIHFLIVEFLKKSLFSKDETLMKNRKKGKTHEEEA